jgi:hypothetical protein
MLSGEAANTNFIVFDLTFEKDCIILSKVVMNLKIIYYLYKVLSNLHRKLFLE